MEDRERQLAWEAAGRPRVAASTIAAGILLLGGSIYNTQIVLSAPTVGLVEGLSPALHGQREALIDPHTPSLQFIDHHAGSVILATVLVALGTLGMVPVLRYLYAATRFRLEAALAAVDAGPSRARGYRLPKAALTLAVAGAGVGAASLVTSEIVDVLEAHNFVVRGITTHDAVGKATNSTAHLVLSSINFASQLALAFAFVMIPLNAMRAGLLTRFMGILGIAGGSLAVILRPLAVLQSFWLVALGLLLTGRGAKPLPAAWGEGEARPWPSQQQVRFARQAQTQAEPAVAAPAPLPRAPARTPNPHAAKKRKKRR